MKRLLNLFLFFLCLCCSLTASAQSEMTKNHYLNDFDGPTISDANASISGYNITNAVQSESVLTIDATGGKRYDPVIAIIFSSPLDLSNNAKVTIEGKIEDLLRAGVACSPKCFVSLYDDLGNRTGGDAQVWSFGYFPATTGWSITTLDLKQYPASVDYTKIKRLSIAFQDASGGSGNTFDSGKFLFRKIELGALIDNDSEIETSYLSARSFLNDFNGESISDANQTASFSSVTGSQADGVLDIYAAGVLSSWKDFFIVTLATPIDLSRESDRKVAMKFVIEDLVDATSGTTLGIRLYDADGTNKIYEKKFTPGSYDDVYNITAGLYSEGGSNGFDFSQVKSFRISTRGSATASGGHLKIDRLQIGGDIIPVSISFDSFTAENGLTIAVNPAAPLMDLDNAFVFEDFTTGNPVAGVTASLQESGAKFNFTGLDATNKYALTLHDTLYYNNRTLIFSSSGMLKQASANAIKVTTDSIVVEFDRPMTMEKAYFSLKNATTSAIIPIDRISSAYGGQEYHLFALLEEATDYTLEILAPGYTFGEPLSIRVGVNPVHPVVNWSNVLGQLTADHWGVNDNGPGMSSVNTNMQTFFDKVQPGVIRRHNAGFLNSWVDNDSRAWNVEQIKSDLDNSKDTYKHSRVMLCLDTSPNFIGALPLSESQEDEVAAFFAQLPGIISSLGYHPEMYEFFNEKEGAYSDRTAYWRVLNKIAIALKTADPTIKVGGPAESWPTIYGSFIDNCGANMDFVSFHLYNNGPGGVTDAALMNKNTILGRANAAKAVVTYLKSKGLNHIETFLDEYNVQYVYTPYEPRHHNHVGAAWMACFIKNVALGGVTGLNVWNTQDGAYGLNYNSAPANLFLMSRKYLRGGIAESSEVENKIEMLPIISANGEKSILFVNLTGEKVTVVDAKDLIGGDLSAIRGLRLDNTTGEGSVYTTETIGNVPVDVVLNPYGMVLLTNVAPDAVSAPSNLKAVYKLENEIGLTWSSDAFTRRGFRITANNEFIEDFKAVNDTAYVLKGLEPNTAYSISVSTIDEYGNVYSSGETILAISTRKMPLKVNDRTVGTGLHQWNYDKNWSARVSGSAYNKDVTRSKATVNTATIEFKGHTVAFYGSRTEKSNLINIYIDNALKKTITGSTSLFGNISYYDDSLTDGNHTLKIEADATYSIDRLDIFGSMFENVTANPDKVQNVDVLPTTSLINLTWSAPAHVSGIQYYRVLTTTPDFLRTDTVCSPEFTITGLDENATYPVVIEAYDPCGNRSESDVMQLSTTEKKSVEIAKLAGTITIDGNADEAGWENAQRLDITNSSQTVPPEPSNLSGWFKALWAQRYLYFYIHVTDDVKVARTDETSDLNENDGFELYIDGGNDKTGPYSLQDASVNALYSPVLYEEYNNVRAMEYAVADTEDGYNVEIRYNLTDLGMVPGLAGKELGLDIHLNDNDKTNGIGLDNKLTWRKKSENAALNKALLGDMILVDELSNGIQLPGIERSLNIYPNPVTDRLNLSLNSDLFTVTVYDYTGRPVAAYKNQKQIPVSNWAPGLYLIQVILPEGKIYNNKFIKK
jgi:xylan 1,4-beta-xylosidase